MQDCKAVCLAGIIFVIWFSTQIDLTAYKILLDTERT